MAEWHKEEITLAYPFEVGGRSVTTLTVHEPAIKLARTMEQLKIEEGKEPTLLQSLEIISAVVREPIEVVENLHAKDFDEVLSKALPLLEKFSGELKRLKETPEQSTSA